ncbi:MAG TPA: RnfABCDGE type electron transport complex subunit D [Bacillota bacterium]|nr:RnfABCDGE type electron transport complex subunit D [Bacillota bacterium]HOP69652.1 RnfABCDGE type electron transport complex subunit D [Bacillota bacterium]HPT34565.1 RnfABCDGE type electron transport complex subunit D [Bacillota bacterium]HQD06521.1 RnfABCDGE type electron transport complex subunit D [Bacillota bacterium]
MNGKFVVSSSPHIRTMDTIPSIMIDVLVALFPAALAAVYFFGYRALITMAISMAAAMIAEAICLRKLNIFGDGSAAVTGLLLAMTLPASAPWWLVVIGAVVAIVIGKQVFGGIGSNIFNPALVGRAFLVASWGGHMAGTVWPAPKLFDFWADIITVATPLNSQEDALKVTLKQLFLGNVAGALGETCALALIIGALWLFYKGRIDWRIPGGYLGTVFIMGALLGGGFYENALKTGLFHVLAGGVLLGALFMATDMVTSPVTPWGRLIFGVGCGVITMLIRLYGAYPEGVTFAILIMNALTPIIDNFTQPKSFGGVKRSA